MQVDAATKKRVKLLIEENEALKSNNTSLRWQLNNAITDKANAEKETAMLKREIDRKNQLLVSIGGILYRTSELFKKAVNALIPFAQRYFTKYGVIIYAGNPHMDETETIEEAIKQHCKGQNPHIVGEWLALTASKIGELSEHEAERANRTAFEIAHYLDIDRQENYGIRR